MEAGKKGDDFKKFIQVTDRLAEKINRADTDTPAPSTARDPSVRLS
jgi:hypothetical protein